MTIINQVTSFKISGFSYNGTDTQLNYTSGVNSGVGQPSKALVLNASGNITSGINILNTNSINTTYLTVNGTLFTDGTLNNLETLNGAIIGNAIANKVLIVDSSRNITNINSITSTNFIGLINTNNQPNITNIGTLTNLNTNGNLNIIQHNGTSTGLQLAGVLVTANSTEINVLKGITATTSELNKLNGVLTTTAEFNKLNGLLTTTAELNKLNGVLTTTAEFNKLNGVTDGIVTANKIVIVDTSRNLTNLANLTTTNNINIGGRLNLTNIQLGLSHKYTTGGLSEIITYTDGIDNNYIGTSTDNDFAFSINSTRYLILKKTTGRIGINTMNPLNQLDINSSSGNCLRLIYNNSNGTSTVYNTHNIDANGIYSISIFGSSPYFNLLGGYVKINDTTISTNFNNGSLVILGGAGISGSLNVNNNITTQTSIMVNKTSSPNAIADFIGSASYLNGSYNKLLRCSSSNASPVQIELQCHNGLNTITTNNAWFGTITNNDLILGTNNNNNFTIKQNGNIGINNINPSYQLDISGNLRTTSDVLFSSASNSTSITTGALVITGGVGIGNSLYIGGVLNVIGNITGVLATNVQPNITSTGNLTIPNQIQITNGTTPFIFNNATSNSSLSCTIQNSGGSIDLGSITNHDLYFRTNNVRCLFLDKFGNIDILLHNTSTLGLKLAGVLITSSADELNILDGVTATTAELNFLDIATIGIGQANKAVILDSNRDISNINHIQNAKITITNSTSNTLTLKNTDITGMQNIYFDGAMTGNKWEVGTRNQDAIEPKNGFYIYNNDFRFVINSTGNIGIGTTTPTYKLHVNGDINISNTNVLRINGNDISSILTNITLGTASFSKVLTVDSSLNLTGINNLTANSFIGTLSTASQPNITSVGTLTTLTCNGLLYANNTTASTSSTTGALIVSGGLGVAGAINTANIFRTTATGQGYNHSNGVVTLVSWINDASISNTAYFGTSTNSHLSIQTNNSERLKITSTGDIGIGGINPAYKFDISGTFRASGNSFLTSNTTSSNTSTGALVVTGGVGIGGNCNIAGYLNASGGIIGTLTTSSQPNINSIGTLTGLTSSGIINITNTTAATSLGTGSLICSGGLSVSGRIYCAGDKAGIYANGQLAEFCDSTCNSGYYRYMNIGKNSGSYNCGILQYNHSSDGSGANYFGIGMMGLGSVLTINGSGLVGIYNTSPSYNLDVNGNIRATSGFYGTIYTSSQTSITSVGTLSNLTTSGQLYTTSTASSSSTTTGALRVNGGAGIAGNCYIGGNANISGNISTTQNIAAGTQNIVQYVYISDSTNYGRFIGNWSGSDYWAIGSHDGSTVRIGTCSNSTGAWSGYANTRVNSIYCTGSTSVSVNGYAYYTPSNGPNWYTGVAAQTNAYSVYASGRIACNGEINVISDYRTKNSIEELSLDYCKNFILTTKPVKFKYNNDKLQYHFGYIAQDVYKAGFIDLVALIPKEGLSEIIENDGFINPKDIAFSMSTNELIPILAKNIKNIYDEKKLLEEKVTNLENKNKLLEEQLNLILTRLTNLESYVE